MDTPKHHWLEKVQVQVAVAAAMAVMYALLRLAILPTDPAGPVVFLPYGRLGAMFLFASVIWVLAIIVAVVIAPSRPAGSLLAIFCGAATASLYSPSLRYLLWIQADGLRPVYGSLLQETVLWGVVLIVAVLLVAAVRKGIGRVAPNWLWKNPPQEKPKPREALLSAGACFGLTLLMAVPVLVLLMQSPGPAGSAVPMEPDRGQIVFAIFVAFAVSAGVAQQFFPSRYTVTVWLTPVVMGVFFYAMAAVQSTVGGVNAWMNVAKYARPLPVDWAFVGSAGAMLGYWFSERVHETRLHEKAVETKEQ